MKCYLLLRDNKQTGPFSFEEIKSFNLLPTDLIWKEGTSSCWKYPHEISEFSEFSVIDGQKEITPANNFTSNINKAKPKSVYVALPSNATTTNGFVKSNSTKSSYPDVELKVKYDKPLDEMEEMYVEQFQNLRGRQKRNFNFYNIGVPVGMFAALIFSAFIIKQIIESFDDDVRATETTSVAIPYQEEQNQEEQQEEPGAEFQNALTTETISDTMQKAPKKKLVENLKNLVSIKGGDYKKRILGGIEGLELTVTNKSSHVLDKVEVEVDYLKPKGEIVKTEIFEISSVPAKGTKTFSVPPSNRGVKVKYKVRNIYSRQHKATLVQA